MDSYTMLEERSGGDKESGAGMAEGWTPEMENSSLSRYLMVVLAVVGAIVVIWRIMTALVSYIRTVTCLTNEKQFYFAKPSPKFSWVKKHLLYSPMFRKRHNREFQLSSAINVGTLPTRFQFVLLLGYFATNVAFCFINISMMNYLSAAKQVRNRSGQLAVVNMIPLFLLAGRNNPLIGLLGVSFDTMNLIHRWLGRIVVLESVIHTVAFWCGNSVSMGWTKALMSSWSGSFKLWGFIGTIAFVAIFIQAASISRHAFYETFKIMHIALSILAIMGVWYHLDIGHLAESKEWLIPVIPIWIMDRLARFLRLAYHNFGSGGTKTVIEALPGNAVRITVNMPRPWTFRPGQHAYLYMPAISFWQSHPFSLAWSEEEENLSSEKLAMNRQDVLAMRKTSMSFVIRARTGMTNTLFQRAADSPEGRFSTTTWVEGPYGGEYPMHSYGSVMLFAGGVGIAHAVPHVRDLVAGYANGTVATRKVVLVWIIQSPEHLEWIRPWMTQILAMDRRRDVLRIMLFVSRPRSTKEIHSPSSTVQMFPGRPNIDTLLAMEMENQVGAMGVSVCGPGSLSDEVRQAVRRKQYNGVVDLHEEAFSW